MDASSRLSGYSAAHIPALLRICGTTEGSEARDQALKHGDAILVRDETHRNKSNPDFKARLSKFALSGAALRAKDAGDPLVFPTEAWDLLRALMVLNPATPADYFVRGRIIGRRTDQDALAEYRNVIYNVAGKGGAPPFGAITFSKPALSLSEALRNAPRLWLEFLRGPARSFIGFLPRQLPRPMFDEKQVAEFLDYSRDSLIIPAGKAGRYLLKAMMDLWRRRYVWREQHVDGPLLTQLLYCCRHDQPPSVSVIVGDHMRERGDAAPCGTDAEMLGEAGAAADSRPSSSVAGTLSGAFVAKALARALNLVETDGKKGAIGTGCQASLKLVFCDSADVVLVMRGAASHNHSAESDDIFFPLHPGVLEYVHKSLQKKRDPLALTNVSREIRAANMVLSHQYKLLLRHGPNAAVLATIAPTVIGAPPSAERERSRGIGPSLPPVVVAAAKTIAAHDDSVFADPVICYCGGSFDVAKDEVPISCSGGSKCKWGGLFHYECIDSLTLEAAKISHNFMCRDCQSAVTGRALLEADDNDSEVFESSVDAPGSAMITSDTGAATAASSAALMPVVSEPASPAAVRARFGACGIYTAFRTTAKTLWNSPAARPSAL